MRPYGVIRIDSAASPDSWYSDPPANQKLIAQTFREACDVASEFGERLAAEGEICWGGMHSWRSMVELLELVDRPRVIGFQADMAHTLLYVLGYNAPEDALLPGNYDWKDEKQFENAYRQLTTALRPWTIDFHVAQNDATVKGSGSHDKTGRHCLASDPNGKLNIPREAGHWLRDDAGKVTRAFRHICWGRLHVSQRGDEAAEDLERHPWRDAEGKRRSWLGGVICELMLRQRNRMLR